MTCHSTRRSTGDAHVVNKVLWNTRMKRSGLPVAVWPGFTRMSGNGTDHVENCDWSAWAACVPSFWCRWRLSMVNTTLSKLEKGSSVVVALVSGWNLTLNYSSKPWAIPTTVVDLLHREAGAKLGNKSTFSARFSTAREELWRIHLQIQRRREIFNTLCVNMYLISSLNWFNVLQCITLTGLSSSFPSMSLPLPCLYLCLCLPIREIQGN